LAAADALQRARDDLDVVVEAAVRGPHPHRLAVAADRGLDAVAGDELRALRELRIGRRGAPGGQRLAGIRRAVPAGERGVVDGSDWIASSSSSPPWRGENARCAFSFISLQIGLASGRPMVFSISRSVLSVSHSPAPARAGSRRKASDRMSPIDSSMPVFQTR